jgi:uncharacterized membrane protein YhaH (DUF805 family)
VTTRLLTPTSIAAHTAPVSLSIETRRSDVLSVAGTTSFARFSRMLEAFPCLLRTTTRQTPYDTFPRRSPMKWFLQALTNTFNFSGRARRREYWSFHLFVVLILITLTVVDFSAGLTFGDGPVKKGMLSTLAGFVFMIPSFAVTVRRLHDTGRSGAWFFLCWVPLIGVLFLLGISLQDSEGDNQYGPNPKQVSDRRPSTEVL